MIGISLDELDTSDLQKGKYWKAHPTRGFPVRMAYIYVLVNPLDETICYVGRTKQPEQRLREHINDAYIRRKIFGDPDSLYNPVMRIIERTDTLGIKDRERVNILYFLKMGCCLTNASASRPNAQPDDVFPKHPYDRVYKEETVIDYSI